MGSLIGIRMLPGSSTESGCDPRLLHWPGQASGVTLLNLAQHVWLDSRHKAAGGALGTC